MMEDLRAEVARRQALEAGEQSILGRGLCVGLCPGGRELLQVLVPLASKQNYLCHRRSVNGALGCHRACKWCSGRVLHNLMEDLWAEVARP
jgi:hypothetical protein